MALAELPKDYSIPHVDSAGVDLPAEENAAVRMGIHDASRLEWSVSLPLPGEGERAVRYAIEVEMEIPANAFARHSPWDQLQTFTRLDGPAEPVKRGDPVSIDALRRGAVALANKLSRASDGFARHCRLASSMMLEAPPSDLEPVLKVWIDAALRMVEDARVRLSKPLENEAQEVVRERELVDEYASVRLLEMLAGVERALAAMSASRHAEVLAPVVARIEAHVADALEKEVLRRAEKRYIGADPTSSEALERYLDRASRLKKHFQEVLFLEPERYEVADRIHHWVAAFVAVVASTWAFIWQIVLINQAPSTGSQIGSGVIVLAVIAGLVYAGKDRIKELGRSWISGNVHRLYAQRVARFRAPRKRLPGRDVIVSARESIDQKSTQIPDTLNPESGATMPATLIKYIHKGEIESSRELSMQGVRRIKHVFRYDLSPLFARLDDATKPVPVLDAETHRVRFIKAPRCYRVPVRVSVTRGAVTTAEEGTIVLHKRGLDRVERAPAADESDPELWANARPLTAHELAAREAAKESGIEPG
jgi:hypothetical protein